MTTLAPLDLTQVDPAEILAMAARLRTGGTPMGDETWRVTPIGRMVVDYLTEQEFLNYSPKTLKHRRDVLKLLAFDYAHLQPHEVTLGHLKAFLANRWSDAALNTKATYTSHVRSFFAWADDNELIPDDPARRLRSPRQKDTEKRAYPLDVIRRLVMAQDMERDRIALRVLYHCALRRNELRLVQFRHIDLTHRVLTVFGKGGKILEQNLPEELAIDLERYILFHQPASDEFLLFPWRIRKVLGSHDYVIDWAKRNQPYTIDGISRWFERCRRAANLEHVHMHEIRHSAGTHFHQAGHDLVATQEYMRHENAATTANTYIHIDRVRTVADVQRRMPRLMDDEA